MILATRYAGNRELRFGPNTSVAPFPVAGRWTPSGQPVTTDAAVGLAAFGRAIRLVSGVIASMPIYVYEGRGGEKAERPDTAPAKLLANPCAGMSVFDWRHDLASSLEAEENAFALKGRARGLVVELYPIPNACVYGRLDRSGGKLFDVWTPDGWATLTTHEVLHIRGQTVGAAPFGVSRFVQHADPVGAQLAAQRFEGSYWRNHARPDLAIIYPQGVTKEQGREWTKAWNEQFGGPENAGKAMPLGGGATVHEFDVSLKDSQFVEGRQFGVEEAGRIMDVDPALLGAPEDGDVRKTALELFLRLQLPPRLVRFTSALHADPDIFPLGSPLYPAFAVDDLMFADPLTRAQVQHYRVQDGTELVDEARADNGRPPLPPVPEDPTQTPGMVPQITPVGGAPALPVASPEE